MKHSGQQKVLLFSSQIFYVCTKVSLSLRLCEISISDWCKLHLGMLIRIVVTRIGLELVYPLEHAFVSLWSSSCSFGFSSSISHLDAWSTVVKCMQLTEIWFHWEVWRWSCATSSMQSHPMFSDWTWRFFNLISHLIGMGLPVCFNQLLIGRFTRLIQSHRLAHCPADAWSFWKCVSYWVSAPSPIVYRMIQCYIINAEYVSNKFLWVNYDFVLIWKVFACDVYSVLEKH